MHVNYQEEVFVILEAVSHWFDHFDLVDAFAYAGVQRLLS